MNGGRETDEEKAEWSKGIEVLEMPCLWPMEEKGQMEKGDTNAFDEMAD